MAPRKLIEVSEAQKKDPNSDRYIFAYMKVIWKEGDTFYVAHHPERESFVSGRDGYIPIPSFDLDSIPAPPPVPSRHLLATIEPGLTEAPAPLPENTYVKYPPIGAYNGTGDLGEILLAEAHTFEFLKKHPHPNICHYYGYVRDASGEYLAGLCLKRYRCTLYDAVQSGETFDRGAVINGVRAGIESLHSSGLVHNDLNPANIMFDYDGNVVIIDFDGCQRDGEVLGRKGGTYGWADPNARIATRANDFYALDKLVEYLTEGPGAAQPPA